MKAKLSNHISGLATFLLATLASISFSSQAFAQLKGNLTVEVNGLRNQKGNVCINVFHRSVGFPADATKALKSDCVKITASPLLIRFQGLPFANYAISLFHDENADDQFNRASFGLPTEGYGFSNNPKAIAAPAPFGQASFILAGKATKVRIKLIYLN